MSVIRCSDYSDMGRRAADYVFDMIRCNRVSSVALPTGKTPRLMYAFLAGQLRCSEIDITRISFVNLDEYVGLANDHPQSFAYELQKQFFSKIGMKQLAVRLLNGAAQDLSLECRQHEEWIARAGGIDLAVLGIGSNGHIAFNEPGTPFNTRTHISDLAVATTDRIPSSYAPKPSRAITLGIGTILEARMVLLMASGEEKAPIIRRAFHEPPSVFVPASALQSHPCVTIIADRSALRESR